jgi:predicted metal-dependent phosphoesterase TrpH
MTDEEQMIATHRPTAPGRADLHIHTLASDGQLTLASQFAYARGNGLAAIAVADLDVLPDPEEGKRFGSLHGVEFIPGVEITAGWEGHEIHILGYHVDPGHRQLRLTLDHLLASREAHVQIMLYKLNRLDVRVRWDDVRNQALHARSISRVHIARAMAERGFISSPREAFSERYIGVDGECYYPTTSLPALDVITLLTEAGGCPVLAHPALHNHHQGFSEEEVLRMKTAGLKGLEVHHACHTPEDVERYARMAQRLGLLMTGGSGCRGVDYAPVVNYRAGVSQAVAEHLIRKAVAA